MDGPRRIVVLDDDPRVRELVQAALKAPEFEVHAFGDGRDALMKLHDIAPEIILSDVWMPDVDGRLFMQVVKRSPVLRDVPFLFLTACDQKTVEAALEGGANGYLMKPFPISVLRQRVRSLLGMPTPAPLRPLEIAAPVRPLELAAPAPGALLPPPGPPTPVVVPHPSATLDPAPIAAPPPNLQIRPIPGPPARPQPTLLRPEPAEPEPATPPLTRRPGERVESLDWNEREVPLTGQVEGCFTMAFASGRQVPVLTEAANRPNFTITTCMTANGRAIRKIETSWQHPLERREDLLSAQKEVRLQHEQALATLKQLDLSRLSRRVVWDSKRRLVDGDLLCWALTAIWREARGRLGNELAQGLLRANFDRLSRTIEGLRTFRIGGDGRVVLNVRGGPLVPHAAAVAAAEWAVAFVTASRTSGETAVSAIRRATAARESRLERIGFATAVGAAAERAQRRSTELTGSATRPYHDR